MSVETDFFMENSLDIAWAAGLFEGEGSVFLAPGGKARMSLNMTDEDVVKKFHSVVGCGQFRGPYARGIHKVRWDWTLSKHGDIERLYDKFKPYLGVRRSKRFREVLRVARKNLPVFIP